VRQGAVAPDKEAPVENPVAAGGRAILEDRFIPDGTMLSYKTHVKGF